MKKVLILGGYGGFGARLSKRLAASGWQVLVAGRNQPAAESFCAATKNMLPIVADRNGDISQTLEAYQPYLLIDAAGPFQASHYRVVEACIAHKTHYLDLADARDFVTGIEQFDIAAREAGVCIISGASSVPALSGAVISKLTSDMDSVSNIETTISASSQATVGASVATAILLNVGRPVKLWIGRQWRYQTGWHMLRRSIFQRGELRPLKRLTALVDVPDHGIFTSTLKGNPSVVFRAGPEFAFQTFALWVFSWFVKRRWCQSLTFLVPVLMPFQSLFARFGSDTSAMQIELKGLVSGKALKKHWTLIAENGDGPEIPTLAAEILAHEVGSEKLSFGARNSASELSLDQFSEKFSALAIKQAVQEEVYEPLYKRVMGERYHALAGTIQDMHLVVGDAGASGTGSVKRGRSHISRFMAFVMRFPPEGEHELHVSFQERNGKEYWLRDFGGHKFSSELSQNGRYLVERFGPMRFYFDLQANNKMLAMVLRKWTILSVPMPLSLAPKSPAKECEENGSFCFDVPISLPMIGLIVRYTGKLKKI